MIVKRQVQAYLDQWYADFNIVLTLQKPTSGDFYAEVVTSQGDWCGYYAQAGVAPWCDCDQNGGTAYAFCLPGLRAKDCAAAIAQEQAHLVGIAHTASPTDVMYPGISIATGSRAVGFEDRKTRRPAARPPPGTPIAS